MNVKKSKQLKQEHLVADDVARASDASATVSAVNGDRERDNGLPDTIQWGEAPSDSGHAVPTNSLEDEFSVVEKLVTGGVEAADTDRRKASEIGRQDQTRLYR